MARGESGPREVNELTKRCSWLCVYNNKNEFQFSVGAIAGCLRQVRPAAHRPILCPALPCLDLPCHCLLLCCRSVTETKHSLLLLLLLFLSFIFLLRFVYLITNNIVSSSLFFRFTFSWHILNIYSKTKSKQNIYVFLRVMSYVLFLEI